MKPPATFLSPAWLRLGLAGGLLWLAAFAAPGVACAAEVAVAVSRQAEAYETFLEALRGAMPGDGQHHLVEAGTLDALDEAAVRRAEVVLAVGPEAADALAARGGPPVLAVLLTAENLQVLRHRHPDAALSGIVLDQPLDRQMRLIHAALPQATRIGAVLGPHSAAQRAALLKAAEQEGIEVSVEQLDSPAALLPALERLLPNSDALLALPDPVAFGATSARTVLLTTYRYRRPLIAYSRAYVQAGAMAAVYSSPADAARQVAEWLAGQRGDRIKLPPIQPPRYFSIAVNGQVARALALPLPDEAALVQAVAEGEAP